MTFPLAMPSAAGSHELQSRTDTEQMSAGVNVAFANVIAQMREKQSVGGMSLTCQANGGFNGKDPHARQAVEWSHLSAEMSENGSSERRRRSVDSEKSNDTEVMADCAGSGSMFQRRHVSRLVALAAQLQNGFDRMVRVLLDDTVEAGSRVTISIPLEGIGEIRLDVRMVQKEIFVVAHGPDDETAQILALGIGELDARLSAAGFHLARVDVVTSK